MPRTESQTTCIVLFMQTYCCLAFKYYQIWWNMPIYTYTVCVYIHIYIYIFSYFFVFVPMFNMRCFPMSSRSQHLWTREEFKQRAIKVGTPTYGANAKMAKRFEIGTRRHLVPSQSRIMIIISFILDIISLWNQLYFIYIYILRNSVMAAVFLVIFIITLW